MNFGSALKNLFLVVMTSAQLLSLVGLHFLFLKYQQNSIRKEIKTQIKKGVPDEDLVYFKFFKSDPEFRNLNWTKPNKEFRYNNEMYDVVYSKIKGNIIEYKCIHDVKESGLFENLDDLASKHPDNKNIKNLLLILSQFQFINNYSIVESTFIKAENKSLNITSGAFFYNSLSIQPIAPPPKSQRF